MNGVTEITLFKKAPKKGAFLKLNGFSPFD